MKTFKYNLSARSIMTNGLYIYVHWPTYTNLVFSILFESFKALQSLQFSLQVYFFITCTFWQVLYLKHTEEDCLKTLQDC